MIAFLTVVERYNQSVCGFGGEKKVVWVEVGDEALPNEGFCCAQISFAGLARAPAPVARPSPSAFAAPFAQFDHYRRRHGEQRALNEFEEGC